MDEQSIDTNTEKEWNLNFHGNSYMIDILSQGNIIIITNIIISSMTTPPSLSFFDCHHYHKDLHYRYRLRVMIVIIGGLTNLLHNTLKRLH